jgi:hypothetical protein
VGYLVLNDYKTKIQDKIFNQLVQNNYAKRVQAENAALDIVISHLTQKYSVDDEFLDLVAWSPTRNYAIRERVIIDYADYNSASTYNIDDCVIYAGSGYRAAYDGITGTWDGDKWDYLGAQYTIYYAAFPSTCTYQGNPVSPSLSDPLAPMFDVRKNYFKDDVVYWKGNTYVCVMATKDVAPGDLKQYYVYENVPLNNVFPDDTVNNVNHNYWSLPTAVQVEAGTLPTLADAWTAGDNRNPSIVECMKHITIWILSDLVSFGNRPVVWEDCYKMALERLRGYAEGKTTLRIPLIQPSAGKRIRFGGGVRQQWAI